MPFNKRQLLALSTLLQLGETYYTIYTGFSGYKDPSNYIFYDPVEQCNNVTEPCITSFKYCTHDPSEAIFNYQCHESAQEDRSWISEAPRYGGVIWVADRSAPMPIYTDALYTLKWQNTNPEYPTTVTWRSYDGDIYFYKGNAFLDIWKLHRNKTKNKKE